MAARTDMMTKMHRTEGRRGRDIRGKDRYAANRIMGLGTWKEERGGGKVMTGEGAGKGMRGLWIELRSGRRVW
jgi:hypothetical protein